MKKGIGPRGLGAPKSAAKMYGAKSPAKQTSEYGKKHDRLVKRAVKLEDKGMREELGRSTFTTEEWKAGVPASAKGKKIQKADKLGAKADAIRAEHNARR